MYSRLSNRSTSANGGLAECVRPGTGARCPYLTGRRSASRLSPTSHMPSRETIWRRRSAAAGLPGASAGRPRAARAPPARSTSLRFMNGGFGIEDTYCCYLTSRMSPTRFRVATLNYWRAKTAPGMSALKLQYWGTLFTIRGARPHFLHGVASGTWPRSICRRKPRCSADHAYAFFLIRDTEN